MGFYKILLLIFLFPHLNNFGKELTYPKNDIVNSFISTIPKKEKKQLCFFFKSLLVLDHFGYVLFGKKTVSISSFQSNLFYSNNKKRKIAWNYFLPFNIKIKKGYKIWEKYKYIFTLKNFIIKIEKNPWAGDQLLILIINKKIFINCIKNNLMTFQETLKQKICPYKILKQIEKKSLLTEILSKHEGLIGIILGYGKENSWEFHNEKKLDHQISKLSNPWHQNKIYENINKNLNSYDFLQQFMDKHSQDLNLIHLPDFKAISHSEETKELTKKYIETRKEMIKYYKNKNFLEATLKLLMKDENQDISNYSVLNLIFHAGSM